MSDQDRDHDTSTPCDNPNCIEHATGAAREEMLITAEEAFTMMSVLPWQMAGVHSYLLAVATAAYAVIYNELTPEDLRPLFDADVKFLADRIRAEHAAGLVRRTLGGDSASAGESLRGPAN